MLDVLDDALAREGADLVDRRARLLAELLPHAEHLHETIAFGVGALIGFLWALRDGSRMAFGPVAVRWVFVSVLGALGFWVFGAVREPEAALSDLTIVAPMIASFVLVPADVPGGAEVAAEAFQGEFAEAIAG